MSITSLTTAILRGTPDFGVPFSLGDFDVNGNSMP